MRITMLSQAGKIHQKTKRIKPLSKSQRQRVYASCQITHQSRVPSSSHVQNSDKKYSPFNTISRQARDSYLLRVTKEPNTQTNYQLNFKSVLKRDRRSTIDQAQFTRIIGPVNLNDYKLEGGKGKRDHRCTDAFKELAKGSKPLTARQMHSWRKTYENLDFQKQTNPQRNNVHDYLKQMKSTDDSFMLKTLRQTTESNFNNYKRFSLIPRSERAHNFTSDSPHKYLDKVLSRQIQPEYNIQESKQQYFRPSMHKPRGQLRFNLYRNQIKTRIDRSDPHWMQTLDYTPDIINDDTIMNGNRFGSQKVKKMATIDFQNCTDRCQNLVYSGYPIRQALRVQVPNNRVN